MGKEGLEPSPRKRHDPKSCASANSATPPVCHIDGLYVKEPLL